MHATMETVEEPSREVPYDGAESRERGAGASLRTQSDHIEYTGDGRITPPRLTGNAVLAESRGFQRRKLFPFRGLLVMCACACPLRPS